MANLDDLAELVLRYRADAERVFASELLKLEAVHGSRTIGRALEIAGRRAGQADAISIAAARARREAQRRHERRAQRAFREQHDDEPAGASRLRR
jgi:hypothetical protein